MKLVSCLVTPYYEELKYSTVVIFCLYSIYQLCNWVVKINELYSYIILLHFWNVQNKLLIV